MLRNSASAISWLLAPCTTSCRASDSRRLSPSSCPRYALVSHSWAMVLSSRVPVTASSITLTRSSSLTPQVDGPLHAMGPGEVAEVGAQRPVDRDDGGGAVLEPGLESRGVALAHHDDVEEHHVRLAVGWAGRVDPEG